MHNNKILAVDSYRRCTPACKVTTLIVYFVVPGVHNGYDVKYPTLFVDNPVGPVKFFHHLNSQCQSHPPPPVPHSTMTILAYGQHPAPPRVPNPFAENAHEYPYIGNEMHAAKKFGMEPHQ